MSIPTDTLAIGSAGALLLVVLWPRLRRAYRTRRWRPAVATVLESWLDDGGGNPSDRRVKVCTRYRFSADGTTYIGERIGFASPVFRDHLHAERRLAQLQPGKRIEVWYDPAKPADAVIDRTISRSHYLLAAAAMFGVAEVIVTLVVGLIAG